ncbi:MAG: polyprenyl synthetase family protein [Hyphomicrobiaceae bacterium]
MEDHGQFTRRLAQSAADVEARLSQILEGSPVAGSPPRLVAAMRHALLGGGKRFRPFLVLEMAAATGGAEAVRPALDVAAALECVHAYSLVHDDLPAMDNDEVRRGQPTVWKAFDDWTAILAGDALLTLAFEILAESELARSAPGEAARALSLVARLAAAAGPAGMVGGQVLDLEAEKLGRPALPDAAHVRRLQAMKTGALVTFACQAGAIAAGAAPPVVSAARRYGEALGLAFQISDDLLDVTGDVATVGKAVGKDLALGKATLVAIEGIDAARRHLAVAVQTALAALDGLSSDRTDALREAALFLESREH